MWEPDEGGQEIVVGCKLPSPGHGLACWRTLPSMLTSCYCPPLNLNRPLNRGRSKSCLKGPRGVSSLVFNPPQAKPIGELFRDPAVRMHDPVSGFPKLNYQLPGIR